jgi:hypothetical protein
MVRRASFAVIPTRDRPTEFSTCLNAIQPQVDHVIAICHGKTAWDYVGMHADVQRLLYMPEGRANISRMWNMGLNTAQTVSTGPFDVAVLNDDAIPAPDWFSTLTKRMHEAEANGVSERRFPGSDRIAGWAFILNGDARLRADEQFVHWCGDNDLQLQARNWLLVDDFTTPNTLAGTTSRDPETREQIESDSERFRAKWAL